MSETMTEALEAKAPEAEQKPAETQTFNQEQVNALLAEQKRKEREKFAGYDDLKKKAEQFDAAQEAAKSEQERAADAARKAQADADSARSEALRYKAAATHKVDPDYFDLLGSGTEEEIASRAERVGGLLQVQAENEQLKAELEALRQGKPAPLTQRPTAALKPGATAEQIPSAEDDSYPSHWLPPRQQ